MTTLVHPQPATVERLASWTPRPTVSIYLPTDGERRTTDLLPRLHSLARQARAVLIDEQGMDANAAEHFVAPLLVTIEELEAAGLVPEPSSLGAAWFLSDGAVECLSLAAPAGPLADVTEGPNLLPILPTLARGHAFFVLAISQGRVRVFRADRWNIEPVPVPDMPKNMDDALWYMRRETDFNRHGSGAMHASDSGRELHKDNVRQYLHQVDKALAPVLSGTGAPLVVMGVGYEAAMFVNETHYRGVVPTPVVGNPDTLDVATIHERALAATSTLADPVTALADRARELAGTGRCLVEPSEIVAAVRQGAVSDVLVASSLTGGAEGESRPAQWSEIVVAVDVAMAAGVRPHVAPATKLPAGSGIAALLRY